MQIDHARGRCVNQCRAPVRRSLRLRSDVLPFGQGSLHNELGNSLDGKTVFAMALPPTMLNWDDLRVVLAVAENGTISGAAAVLRISHPTLSRRLRRIEARLGTRLFERTPSSCRPTEAGEEIRVLASRLRDDIGALEARIAGRDRSPRGSVRLTAPDAVS